MTSKTFEAVLDCTSKIKGLIPTEEKIKEMLSFLSMIYRLATICDDEGPEGLRVEAELLPENTAYEKIFKECVFKWMNGTSVEEVSDHAASRYFEENPAGFDAALFFAAVYSVANMLKGESGYVFIDEGLQCLLPDGWRWREEDDKEEEAHKDEEGWFLRPTHRDRSLGDGWKMKEEIHHRFDDIKVCKLISNKDDMAVRTAERIADKLTDFRDGALQMILKELTYPELEKVLYVLPEKAENRIIDNLSSYCIPIIKGNCILFKDSVSTLDIRLAVIKFEEALNA
nr:hypothetical protein [Lachnospiraceae bacterium]